MDDVGRFGGMRHLGIDVGGEIIGEEVEIAASGHRVDEGLEKVGPAKDALADQPHHVLKPRVRLHKQTRLRNPFTSFCTALSFEVASRMSAECSCQHTSVHTLTPPASQHCRHGVAIHRSR